MRKTVDISFLSSHVEIFKDFPADRLQEIVDNSIVRTYEENEALALRGSQATHLPIILEGTVSASCIDHNGSRIVFSRLEAGDSFGEIALTTSDPLRADFIADTPCEILQIPLTYFQSVIMTEPTAVRQITKRIAQRMKSYLEAPDKGQLLVAQEQDPYGLALKSEREEKILVINCGSSSLKYSFYDTCKSDSNVRGMVDRIGLSGTKLVQHGPGGDLTVELDKNDFATALSSMTEALTHKQYGVIKKSAEITLVAHRVVHGADKFIEATVITDNVLEELDRLSPLAPLHNPVNIAGIRAMQQLYPAVPHIAVFDTAFHHTIPAFAFLYGLPYEFYKEKHIRRYGFHGTSHQYVSLRAAQALNRHPNELRMVSCHLGNGSSVCAIDHGRSVDTSMGFTPSEGLIMGTRCGDIDSGVLAFLERTAGMSATQSEELLNKKSGLLGLSGISSDMREILKAAEEGNHRALLTLKTYCYRTRRYLGSFMAAMGGLDTVIFTGGIGQGSAEVRSLVLQGLDCMGIVIDEKRNQATDGFTEISRISTDESKVSVLVVPTDEECMMAREALRALSRSYLTQVISNREKRTFLVEVSAHHIHLTQEHVEVLFGKGHKLTKQADLSQPGQFSCTEQLSMVGPKGRIERVRVLGPTRRNSQVEIAMTEQFKLGIHPPIRESGDIADSPGCILEGPAGSVTLERGVICALRHIHMTPEDALCYGVRDKSVVRVRLCGDRELVFGDVLVRVDPQFSLAMHLDTDEANAAHIQTGAQGYIVGIQS
jgi:acetate kinase